MRMTLESTDSVTTIAAAEGGVPVRAWRGAAEDGTPVHALIALVAVPAADRGVADRDLVALDVPAGAATCQAPEPPAGAFVFADDPRAAEAGKAAAALLPAVRFLAAEAGWEATLDALASVYLGEAVRRLGPERAAAALVRMRDGIAAVAGAQAAAGLGRRPPQGRA